MAYWQEIIGEADEQIDLLSENVDNIPNTGSEGLRVMEPPSASSRNQSVQEAQRTAAAQRLARNREASEAYVKKEFPDEKFLSQTAQLQNANKWTKNLTLPENVRLAESRIPKNKDQSDVLKKELRQSGILSRRGNSVYLIPEQGPYGVRLKDAVVNGILFEFRTVTGNVRSFEWEFRDAKRKGKDTNVFVSAEMDISKTEARRRIGLVLEKHPDYTGKIIISLKGKKTYFWDTSSFR
jgi:hypothetical protein